MTYQDAIAYLGAIRQFGMVFGLETITELLRRVGDPQRDLRFLHIAGTNGKGSVAAMCQAALTAAGHRTGLYTSPHLVALGERFQIDGRFISDQDLARIVAGLRPVVEAVGHEPGRRPATFFEVVTALALVYFREQQVDAVVWETGLGGRLDATNVVRPLVAVITSIGRDHTQYLGDTLAAIAAEKCGIIKPGIPVVSAAGATEAQAVVRAAAAAQGCPFTEVAAAGAAPAPAHLVTGESVDQAGPLHRIRLRGTQRHDGEVEITLRGRHQAVNCATAVAALEASGLPLDAAQTRLGLRCARWPGRFQVIAGQPPLVLDGAHNPPAAELLAQAVRECFPGRRVGLVLGVLRDKEYPAVCRSLAPLATRLWCVPVANDRTCDSAELARLCAAAARPGADVQVCPSVRDALVAARQDPDSVVVVTGSLFLVGEVLQQLPPPDGWRAPQAEEGRLQ